MAKQQIHTKMLGRKVRMAGVEVMPPSDRNQPYRDRAGQRGEVVNVYLDKDGLTYTLLFEDGGTIDIYAAMGGRGWFKVLPDGYRAVRVVFDYETEGPDGRPVKSVVDTADGKLFHVPAWLDDAEVVGMPYGNLVKFDAESKGK